MIAICATLLLMVSPAFVAAAIAEEATMKIAISAVKLGALGGVLATMLIAYVLKPSWPGIYI